MSVRTAELLMAILLALGSIGLMVKSSELSIGWIEGRGPGSGVWPFWLAVFMGVAAMLEGVDLVKAGKASKIDQDHSKATYESWCKKSDARIDWSKPVGAVHNLIRGTNPQPGAWTTSKGAELQIFDSVKQSGEGGAPGEIMATTRRPG